MEAQIWIPDSATRPRKDDPDQMQRELSPSIRPLNQAREQRKHRKQFQLAVKVDFMLN